MSPRLPNRLFEMHELRESGSARLVLEAVTTGLVTGFVIGLSRWAYIHINHRLALEYLAAPTTLLKVVMSAAFIALCGWIAWWCMKQEPLTGGSGIPQVELAMQGRLPLPWLRVLCFKFFGTLASMCGCLSLGRAAPSVQMGAAIGCGVGGLWRDDGMRPRFLVGGGAAGLAACFGAPVAGVCFAFEELRALPNVPQLIFMGLASLCAWLVTDVIMHLGLVFGMPGVPPDISWLWAAPVLGVVCGLLCRCYNSGVALFCGLADRYLGTVTRLVLAFGLGWVLLLVFPHVIDGLAPTVNALAVNGGGTAGFLLALWAAKFCFNIVSASAGAPGGLLMPVLTVGGFTGALCAGLLDGTVLAAHPGVLIPLGMAAFFAGVVRAPLTAAFLVAETTGLWSHVPALLVVSWISAHTASRTGSQPIFTFMRLRQLRLMRRAARRMKADAGA